MLPNSISSLSREEEVELAWSNKKVKDVIHTGFREGKDLDPTCQDQAQAFYPPFLQRSFKDKLVGEILSAFTQAFNFTELMDDDVESDDEVESF